MRDAVNIQAVGFVAEGLQELRERMVFVGGAVISLYADDPGADLPRPTSDIDLVIELELEVVAKADPRTGAVHWTRTLWSGDPVMAEPLLERLEAELGPGPVGAEAVLFGNVVDADGQPVLATFDGLVQDGTGEARVSLVLSEPDGALTSVGTARSRLEEGSPGGG